MAEPLTVARPYAEAAFKIARDQADLPAWSNRLAVLEAVVSNPQIAACIGDPNISAQQLEALILAAAGEAADGAGRNLIQVLNANDRLTLLPQIRALYEELRRDQEGVLEAVIVSAFPMNDDQCAQLVSRLEAKHGRRISARLEVDPQLIGGVRIVIGDKVLDATVRGRLDAMAAALTH